MWLNNVERIVDQYIHGITHLEDKLGAVFLQMNENFTPKNLDRVEQFISYWPKEIPLAIEFRHTDWYNDPAVSDKLYNLLVTNKIANVITDSAGGAIYFICA